MNSAYSLREMHEWIVTLWTISVDYWSLKGLNQTFQTFVCWVYLLTFFYGHWQILLDCTSNPGVILYLNILKKKTFFLICQLSAALVQSVRKCFYSWDHIEPPQYEPDTTARPSYLARLRHHLICLQEAWSHHSQHNGEHSREHGYNFSDFVAHVKSFWFWHSPLTPPIV